MRDRAFRKGRNAFKNDAEYRAALAGELDDPGTADGIDAARDMLDDYLFIADDIDRLRGWLEKVMAAENGGDLPPNLELEDVDGGIIRFETLGSADRVGLRKPDDSYCEIATTDLQDLLDDLEPYEEDDEVDDDEVDDDEVDEG